VAQAVLMVPQAAAAGVQEGTAADGATLQAEAAATAAMCLQK
jgi:hypothetical protein